MDVLTMHGFVTHALVSWKILVLSVVQILSDFIKHYQNITQVNIPPITSSLQYWQAIKLAVANARFSKILNATSCFP
jgi:hypothetical protein